MISSRLENSTFEQKQQVLRTLQIECVYDDKTGLVAMSGIFGSQMLKLEGDNGPDNNRSDSGEVESLEYQQRKHMHIVDSVEILSLIFH